MPRTATDLPPELLEHMRAIKAKALEYGLDFFEVVYEVLPFEVMNQIAAYGGFPVRYPHWRWGMEYEKLSKRDAYGLGRIYEMVINNDPCYAYLQESNSVTDQKLVMAHVYGHSDFFKCNFWFSRTNRKMMDEMANHSTRVRRHVERQGQDAVERFIDVCLTIEHLIDPHSMFMQREGPRSGQREDEEDEDRGGRRGAGRFVPEKLPAKDYMDPFINPAREMERQRQEYEKKKLETRDKVPARPTRDILLFLMRQAPLEDWQVDVLSIIRDEAYYYAPQAMTKVMNEGWATYWHSKLMTQHFLEAREIVDYADQHSGVVHMPPGGFNPYKIGVELWKDIERRWNSDHQRIKMSLLYQLTNMGQPFIYVVDGNYLNRGELYLAHQYNGLEIDLGKAREVMISMRRLWGRPVHLQLRLDDDMYLVSIEQGEVVRKQKISGDMPPPAHAVG
jgi:stage V sporulation protein R